MADKKRKRATDPKKPRNYTPKVSIPLPFDAAVSGLLAVKPDGAKPSKPKK